MNVSGNPSRVIWSREGMAEQVDCEIVDIDLAAGVMRVKSKCGDNEVSLAGVKRISVTLKDSVRTLYDCQRSLSE
jgi:hypothetical protein